MLRSLASRAARLAFSPAGAAAATAGTCGLYGAAALYPHIPAGTIMSQSPTGTNFFKVKFQLKNKDPDALVDFYSTEDFLQILGVFPFVIHTILAGVEWSTACENTMVVWNTMRISFDITEKEEEIGGKDVITYFNKRERFVQYIPLTTYVLWDQVQNYGFRLLEDGTIEVSHTGEEWYGPSVVRPLIALHATYVAWATQQHFESALFGTEDLQAQEHQRGNIPLYMYKTYWAPELIAARARYEARAAALYESAMSPLRMLTAAVAAFAADMFVVASPLKFEHPPSKPAATREGRPSPRTDLRQFKTTAVFKNESPEEREMRAGKPKVEWQMPNLPAMAKSSA